MDTLSVVRGLLGVGYYRKGATPDLALYLGDRCYPGIKSIFVRLGLDDNGRPYVDHSDGKFDDAAHEISVVYLVKGKENTREAHVRKSRILRDAWGDLACPARGFAKSVVSSEDYVSYTRSFVTNWRTEPGKGKRITVPAFKHTVLSRAIADGKHELHTLSHDDRQTLLTHFAKYKCDPIQIATVLGCSPKTINTWQRTRVVGYATPVPKGAPSRNDLLGVVSRLQDLVGQAIAGYLNDSVEDRHEGVMKPLEEAHKLCIAARSGDAPDAGSKSAFMEKWRSQD